ncbi:hypothetical protein DFQ26_003132 [Actinomortierella ambigua]|nr:hypothetical protein DFQ26_003132 [Actinomortierella ambigua]
MKINTILLLSAAAAIAVATPTSPPQRALYRRDRFRRELPDIAKTIDPLLQTAAGATRGTGAGLSKRTVGVNINGKPPLEGAQEVVGKALEQTAAATAPTDAAGGQLAARDLPGGELVGKLVETATGPVKGLLGGQPTQPAPADAAPADGTTSQLAARDLPGGELVGKLVETATGPVKGLLGGQPTQPAPADAAPAADGTTGQLAARNLPGGDLAETLAGPVEGLLGGQSAPAIQATEIY